MVVTWDPGISVRVSVRSIAFFHTYGIIEK